MFGLLALGGDIGCSVGPWLTGKVSDIYLSVNEGTANTAALSTAAIKAGLLAAIVFPILMMILLLVMRRMKAARE